MKNKESDYLNELFAGQADKADESKADFPLLDVPPGLTARLYAITERAQAKPDSSNQRGAKPGSKTTWTNKQWPRFTSIAASLLMAVVLTLVYQQQQTIKQLEQAQADLATALHYLGEANEITRAQMVSSLNENMNKAAVAPVLQIGRDTASRTAESLRFTTELPSRRL